MSNSKKPKNSTLSTSSKQRRAQASASSKGRATKTIGGDYTFGIVKESGRANKRRTKQAAERSASSKGRATKDQNFSIGGLKKLNERQYGKPAKARAVKRNSAKKKK